MKKFFVLGVLFLLPITAYLFFASGVNNFARLPVMTKDVKDVAHLQTNRDKPVSFQSKISIVAFFGNDPKAFKGNTFNLDKKILEKFYEFKDFQFVIVLDEEAKTAAQNFAEEFKEITNAEHWKFVYGSEEEVRKIFQSFEVPYDLDQNLQTPYVFIIDKDGNLRGRKDDEDAGRVFGYDSRSVSELHNKMNDDVKVVLAEYRLELKRNNNRKDKEL